MKASIIIPTYNRSDMICKTLESLIQQNFPKEEYEIIVIDNNSKDDTPRVVREFIQKHDGLVNISYAKELRQGDGWARNSGAAIASGEYLFFSDDDALLDSNWISCMSAILDMYPQVAMVGSRIVIKWDQEPEKWVRSYEYLLGATSWNTKGYIIKSDGLFIPNGSLAIRKSVFYQVGGNNPGQVGDNLVGNAEVGLFNKVHQLGYPTAFTDDTTMWHMQKASINGSLKDITRRIENTAISDAYTDVIENGINKPRDIVKCKWRMILNLLLCRRTRYRRAYLNYRASLKYNEWAQKYSNKQFVNTIEAESHKLGDNYKSPQIEFCTRIKRG